MTMNNEQYSRLVAVLNDSELRGEVSDLALALRDEGLDSAAIKQIVKLSRDSRRKGDTILHQVGIQPEKQAKSTERRKAKSAKTTAAKPVKRQSKANESSANHHTDINKSPFPGQWCLLRVADFKGARMFRLFAPNGKWEQLGENKLQARIEFFAEHGERLAKLIAANSKEGAKAKL